MITIIFVINHLSSLSFLGKLPEKISSFGVKSIEINVGCVDTFFMVSARKVSASDELEQLPLHFRAIVEYTGEGCGALCDVLSKIIKYNNVCAFSWSLNERKCDHIAKELRENSSIKRFHTSFLCPRSIDILKTNTSIHTIGTDIIDLPNFGELILFNDTIRKVIIHGAFVEISDEIVDVVSRNTTITCFICRSLCRTPKHLRNLDLIRKICYSNANNIRNKNITLFEILLCDLQSIIETKF